MTSTRHLMNAMAAAFLSCLGAERLIAEDESLAAWYRMDEVVLANGLRKIADASGNGRDLTLGDGCRLTNGIAGSGLHFDGTANAWSTLTTPALGNRTVSMLFCREQGNGPLLEGQTTYPYVIASLSTMNLHLYTTTDGCLAYVTGRPVFLNGAAFSRGQWNHLAWVYEQTETEAANVFNAVCKFYRNGILMSTSASYTVTNTAAAGATILGSSYDHTRPIYGVLDEVRVYGAALTDAQVKQEALRSMETGKTPRLLGRWTMEEIVETNGVRLVRDVTGSGYDLRLGDGCQLTGGVDGGALNFNGTTSAFSLFTNGPAVSSWSFAGWVRQNRASETPVVAGNYYPRIFNGNAGNLMMHFSPANNGVTFQGYGHAASQAYAIRPDTGVWAHYAVVNRMVYNATSNDFASVPEFYVNGRKAATGVERVAGKLVWDAGYTLYYGNMSQNSVRPFMGDFDDFRFYDGALSEAQVKAIFLSLPPLSAGSDFTTSAETVSLQGWIDDSSDSALRLGFDALVGWSLVSAPEGGEAAVIETPASVLTRAALPVIGDYVFRLTATNSAYAASDEVTVTRVAVPAENSAPTVTLDATASVALPATLPLTAAVADTDGVLGATRVAWTKVSGPGGVYFDPPFANATEATFLSEGRYVLRCTADDGAAAASADVEVTVTGNGAASLTNGLVRYYPVNSAPYNKEVIGGSTAMTVPRYEAGIAGYGVRSYAAAGYSDTLQTLPESGPASGAPTNVTHLAFSFWMYHDTSDTNVSANAALVDVNYTLGLYYGCQNASPGFILFQQGTGGAAMTYTFPSPSPSPKNRWMHVYASFARATGDELELYIDGAKQTKSASSGKNAGRVVAQNIRLGGMTQTSGGPQGPVTNTVSGGYYSRVFPGVMDEVRIYNRKLAEAEIAALAADPVRVNRGPLTELVAEVLIGNQGASKPLEAVVYDDGLPAGVPLSGRWRIVSGNAAGIHIADETSLITTISLLKVGTFGLQLETTDGERVSYSEVVTVVVNPCGTAILLK